MDQSTGLFSKVLVVGAYTAVFHLTSSWRPWEMTATAGVWVAAFVLSDAAYYWAHRLSHGINILWIGHVVHHQSEDYNLAVALRQSVLQKVLLMWVYWPLAMVGFPPEIFLTCMAVNLLYQFWIHTELVDKLGPLEWVMNTPSHHRVHHGRNPEYIDRNHAGVFIIWDRMFGTFQEELTQPTYGITRPTDTFNPIHAQWKPVADLWNDLKRIPHWIDKVRFLFAAPGWYPESIGGPQSPPAIKGDEQKFNPHPGRTVAVLLIARWLLLLVVALLVLESKDSLSALQLAAALVWVFAALAAVGELWNKGWGKSRLVLAWVVDLTFVPAAAMVGGESPRAYALWVGLSLASALMTWRALSA